MDCFTIAVSACLVAGQLPSGRPTGSCSSCNMRVDSPPVTLAASTRKVGRVVNQYVRKVACDATGEYERENMYRNGREQRDRERDGARPGRDWRARDRGLPQRRKREGGAGGDSSRIRIFAG